MEDEKAASRAAWNRHQRFVRQKKRGRGGGRVGSRRHVLDEVKEQGRPYDEECDESTVAEGDDYEEWLSSCPKEMPSLLRRQRVALPDVSFLLSRMEGNLSGHASVEEKHGDVDLGVLAVILDRLPDSVRLEIPVEICSMLNIEAARPSYMDDVVARDSFAMKQSTVSVLDALHQQSVDDDDDVDQEKVKVQDSITLADDLDALLDLGNPVGRQSSAIIGQGEEEDLDAWFDAL